MQISVGSTLKYNGAECVCTRIEKRDATSYAKVDSQVMEAELRASGNCNYLSLDVGIFGEGDIINTEAEWLELTSPGVNLFFIYTSYKVKKVSEENADTRRSEENVKEAGSEPTEDAGGGTESGESAGPQGVGEGCGAGDGRDQSGEGGAVVHSREGEGS